MKGIFGRLLLYTMFSTIYVFNTECIALLYYICYVCMQYVQMVQSDLLLGLIPLRGEWKCV